MKKRKYPSSLFILGIIINLIRSWYILAATIFFFILRAFNENFPAWIPLTTLALWFLYAIIKQFSFYRTLQKLQGDAGKLLDKLFADIPQTAENNEKPSDEPTIIEANLQGENIKIEIVKKDASTPFDEY